MCHGTITLKVEADVNNLTKNALSRLEEARKALAGEIIGELESLGYHNVETADCESPIYQNGVVKTSETIQCFGLGESGKDIDSMQTELEGVEERFSERLNDLADILRDYSLEGDFAQVTIWLEEPFADGEEDFDEDGNPIDDDSDDYDCYWGDPEE